MASALLLPHLAAKTHMGAWKLAAPIAIVGAATLLVTAPLIIAGGRLGALDTALRAAASTAAATIAVAGYGWATFTSVIGRLVGPGAARSLTLLPASAARLTRRLAALAAAREARSLAPLSLRDRWRLLASSVAGLLDYSYTASQRLEAAVRARTLGPAAISRRKVRDPPASLIPLIPSTAALLTYLAQVLLHG